MQLFRLQKRTRQPNITPALQYQSLNPILHGPIHKKTAAFLPPPLSRVKQGLVKHVYSLKLTLH